MKKLLGRFVRVSPAMIVAMLALFVALTGTAVATTSALITGNNIKNGSITGLDIKNKSVTFADIKGQLRGPRGLRGAAGAAGAPGAKGDKGDTGAAGAPNPNAVNSDKLDGLDADQLTRGASAEPGINHDVSPASANLLNVNAPVAGGLLVTMSFSCASFDDAAALTRWDVNLRVDGVIHGNSMVLFMPPGATPEGASAVVTALVPVAAGNHTISYLATRSASDGSLDCNTNTSSLFTPFGNAGITPTTASSGGVGIGAVAD